MLAFDSSLSSRLESAVTAVTSDEASEKSDAARVEPKKAPKVERSSK